VKTLPFQKIKICSEVLSATDLSMIVESRWLYNVSSSLRNIRSKCLTWSESDPRLYCFDERRFEAGNLPYWHTRCYRAVSRRTREYRAVSCHLSPVRCIWSSTSICWLEQPVRHFQSVPLAVPAVTGYNFPTPSPTVPYPHRVADEVLRTLLYH